MTNPTDVASSANGLEGFDTALLVGLGLIGLWALWRHPVVVAAVVVGLLVWWEQPADDRPILPWLLAFVWFAWRGVVAVARFLVPGARGAR